MDENQLRLMCEKYAQKQGFILNPDNKMLKMVLTGLLKNEERYGYRFCPCRAITGDMEKDRGNICPCIYHKDEIKKDGACRCLLFCSKDYPKK